jgi:WD40 repeat protein
MHNMAVTHLEALDNYIISVAADKTMIVWDNCSPLTISARQELLSHQASITSIGSGATAVWSCSLDGKVIIWNRTPSAVGGGGGGGGVRRMTSLPDGPALLQKASSRLKRSNTLGDS